jgi:hypothetical protein
MDHRQLGATMLAEWGLPDMLIQAAYHHEQPDVAGFRDGSRVQTLTHSLNLPARWPRSAWPMKKRAGASCPVC